MWYRTKGRLTCLFVGEQAAGSGLREKIIKDLSWDSELSTELAASMASMITDICYGGLTPPQ
eukprot:4940127-Pleurochrysis_carterae.AAC.1